MQETHDRKINEVKKVRRSRNKLKNAEIKDKSIRKMYYYYK